MVPLHRSNRMAAEPPGDAAADRRDFLVKLAKTAAYSAPIIRTLATPTHLAAQGLSQKMMNMMNMMNMMMNMGGLDSPSPFAPAQPRAPWEPGVDG